MERLPKTIRTMIMPASNKIKICLLLILSLLFIGQNLFAQNDSVKTVQLVDSVNRLVDRAVVHKDEALMQKYFADDFFFLHSTGMIDSKKTWIKSALSATTSYASREHDSVIVELHPNVAIVSGLLTVRLKPENLKTPYRLRYIRIYVLRKRIWQLVSHHSTAEIRLR